MLKAWIIIITEFNYDLDQKNTTWIKVEYSKSMIKSCSKRTLPSRIIHPRYYRRLSGCPLKFQIYCPNGGFFINDPFSLLFDSKFSKSDISMSWNAFFHAPSMRVKFEFIISPMQTWDSLKKARNKENPWLLGQKQRNVILNGKKKAGNPVKAWWIPSLLWEHWLWNVIPIWNPNFCKKWHTLIK